MEYIDVVLMKLNNFNIPKDAYSLHGPGIAPCLYVKKNDTKWDVCEDTGTEKIVRGSFQYDSEAYDFLYYLVMKKYTPYKKRWW